MRMVIAISSLSIAKNIKNNLNSPQFVWKALNYITDTKIEIELPMHHRSLAQKCLIGIFIGLAAMGSTPVFAYVEPGAGNLILQLIFGGVAGIGLLLKLYWRDLTATLFPWVRSAPPPSQQPDSENTEVQDDQNPKA